MERWEIGSGETLARGVIAGYWTLEALDGAGGGWQAVEHDRVKSAVPRDTRNPNDLRAVPPMRYPGAGTHQAPRNLAREWIAANPQQWESMVNPDAAPEAATSPCGTVQSRLAASTTLALSDARQRAGYAAPTLEGDQLPDRGIQIPDHIDGPLGFRPDAYVANRQRSL